MSTAMICPVCKASNEARQCRRCRADLSILFDLEERRSELLAQAYAQAAEGRWQPAAAAAEQVDELHRGADAQQLRAVCAFMQRDFAMALMLYEQLRLASVEA